METQRQTDLSVSGMTCQNCARHVSEALRSVPGVQRVEVRLEDSTASIRWSSEANPAPEKLIQAVGEAGYQAQPRTEATIRSKWHPLAGWHFNVYFGTAVTVPLLILEWGFGVGMERWYHWLAFLLVLPLQVFGGARFYLGAWQQLKKGQSNMDTLVSLGSTTAFLYSLYGLLSGWHAHVFFMDAAAILTLVSAGHYLEGKASARAASALRALIDLAPPTARRKRADGGEELVPVAELVERDLVLLHAGDRIPTDGEVVEGRSAVDESMLTGESLPVEKQPGSKLYAGTLNENGHLVMQVTATGAATALAHIIEVVQRAQSSRASIQRLADRISSIFVPIVIAVALGTALWWTFAPENAAAVHAALAKYLWQPHLAARGLAAGIFHAAAVLIIACPCAMGLATPIAIMAGTNAAARRGILIRDGSALEKSGKITAVLFDKTGTLTEGKVSVAAAEHLTKPDLSTMAGSLAARSNHPLSRAVAAAFPARQAVEEFEEIRGRGIAGMIEGKRYRLGSLNWLQESGVQTAGAQAFLAHWSGQGATVIGLSQDQQLVSVLALRDRVKGNASEVLREIRQKGLRVYMLTGDSRQTALAIAAPLGIPETSVYAEVRPEGKADMVRKLQEKGERVAFVGDGINDAPALTQADLGIALADASDVARESADIILLRAGLEGIPEAIGLAQGTLRVIKQNLFWAFFYNAAGVPLAALGFLSPMFSAFAMGASDLIVVGNALRLGKAKRVKAR